MRSTPTIITLFISAACLAVGHDLAIRMSWYYLYPAIDIPLHILGGFVVGLFAYLLLISLRHFSLEGSSPLQVLSVLTLSTFFVSLIWELFELVFFLTKDAGLSAETLSDIIFGVVGSVLAWGLVVFVGHKKSRHQLR